MLEKIGLPPKPSLRGNNWVADASHCQGCSCQFTFINRKHHCRRCGGLFCNSCTQQRMVLRGQGDSPVRICEPCKKLEEAARFELRQGRRAGKGSLKSASRYEDEVLNQILGHDRDQSFSSGNQSTNEIVPNTSSSSTKGLTNQVDRDMQNIISNDNPNNMEIDMGSTTPEDLHQQAVEEKKKYKILKGDGKPEEALKAFKRGKELERQANALEIHLRKIRKRISSSGNAFDMQTRDKSLESGKKTKSLPHMDNEKHDVTAELRELGWSDVDIRDEDRKSANLSLEGELSSILGEVTPKTGGDKGSRTDKTQVVALKKKALSLKREGKLAEAKEELKRAKVLEKQLEEQELLAEAEDSDDELSALIRGMDNDNEGSSNLHDHKHDFDFDRLLGISDDVDGNFEVTDEDMMDPEIAVALESLGWTEDSNRHANTSSESQPLDRETLLSEIQSLKREALKQKRVGNAEEAMAFLKKAKLLERELNSYGSQENHTTLQKSTAASSQIPGKGSDFIRLGARDTNAINNADSMLAPKSRLMIQRELLSVKKKALTLRREGKLNEAEAELQKGAALEHQLDEMDKSSSRIVSQLNIGGNAPYTAYKQPDIHRDLPFGEGEEEDVTDQDLSDPTYLSLLTDLGWNDDNNEPSKSSTKPSTKDDDHFVPISDVSLSQHSTNVLVGAPRRSKFEIQRELLGLKRKALALRREGKVEDAEEMLKMAKELEGKIAEMEAPKKEVQVEATRKDKLSNPPVGSAIEEESHVAFTEEDMHDPALDSMLINLGLKDEELKPGSIKEESFKKADSSFAATVDLSVLDSSSSISGAASRSKGEIQKLLELKRKALALRRKGEVEEAEEILRMAKSLEVQMEDGGNQNKEDPLSVSTNEKPIFSESSDLHEMHGSLGVAREVDGCSASSGVGQSSVMVSASNETIGYSTSAEHSMNSPDLLTDSEILIRKQREESKIRSANLPLVGHPISLDTFMTLNQDQGHKNNVTTIKRGELTDAHENPSISETTAQDNASQHHISFHQEILAHKRKAVSLKREGKLAEAREELRQAKLLEKSFENDNMQPKTASRITSNASNVEQKNDSSNIAVKPLSSRDRFKLQQESLGHKRQALKLRREGRMEEAEAEFERAKALETQLDELTAHDAGKSSASLSDSVDDVTVDDFLDPQLLSALKEVGLEDVSVVTRGPEINEPVKSNVSKIENLTQEKIQLEERIKAEKMKAVNLKRQGKQAEALDALRRAKMYEKKMNSITSG